MLSPRLNVVTCASPAGVHRMAYHEWGNPDNPDIVLCVHGLTRTGRDFDDLAQALAGDFRVVCPDVVGRGLSDRLANPMLYAVPQYASDMVTLVARLNPVRLAWVGTSMGGLIGMAYAGLLAQARFARQHPTPAQAHHPLPDAHLPLDRIVLNDVGPHIEPASLARIGQYVGEPAAFGSFDDAVAYVREVSASFGPHTDAQWRELTRFTFIERDGKWVKHYDLGLATPFGAMTPEMTQQGEAMLWAAYASIVAPILIVRGAESDLLSSTTLEQMLARNPRARAVEFAGVGHAPTFMARDQISAVVEFLHGD